MANQTNADNATEQYSATISIESVVKALELNATHGVDDRVIAVPRKTGGTAKVRRAFKGTERYANPQTAPVHIRPESLVDEGWERPPERHTVDLAAIDVPADESDRTDEDEDRIDEVYQNQVVEVWRTDVRGMVRGESTVELTDGMGQTAEVVTIAGVEADE